MCDTRSSSTDFSFLAAKRAEWLYKLRTIKTTSNDNETLNRDGTISPTERVIVSPIEETSSSSSSCVERDINIPSLRERFLIELDLGLQMHQRDPLRWHPEESDLMCLDSCLPDLICTSTPPKTGIYYGIDFGGSNIRFLRGKFGESGELNFTQTCTSLRDCGDASPATHLPKGLLDPRATATMLFDFVADSLLGFMREQEQDLAFCEMCPDFKFPLGFTFSFGFTQQELDAAPLYQWSKDFETGDLTQDPVIGNDICQLLRNAFERKNVPARLVGIMNDAAATLVAANLQRKRDDPHCKVGFIAGTGINGCYYEPYAEIYGYKGKVISTECGGFNKLLPYTEVDTENDLLSSNPGGQRLEKLAGGNYLAEIIRKILLHTFDDLPEVAREARSLSCPAVAQIFEDRKQVHTAFEAEWGWKVPVEDCGFVADLVEAVWLRACRLIGILISGLAEKAGASEEPCIVGVDGSLFKRCARFRREVELIVDQTSGHLKPIEIRVVSDGSGIGAVALAALFNRL